jgi:HD-GYP domain-containing protein (c-di-GMP phosphodiesterase class II)
MFEHKDSLESLNENTPLREKLLDMHKLIKEHHPNIDRVAIAIYDQKTDLLKTYIHSSGSDLPLSNYQSKLSDAGSLQEIIRQNRPRVINDMSILDNGAQEHTQRIKKQGYSASYTLPMFYNGAFFGFVFFNSYTRNSFTDELLNQLDLFGHLTSLLVINELTSLRTLLSAVKTASDITHERDPETGSHLDRMSRYSRLIASELAPKYNLNDDYIEHIFMFSPLHDIGKIAIPDSIMLKPAKLDSSEFEVMKTHSLKGREMIDSILHNFDLDVLQHVNILRNIAEYHHESVNGSGYPRGLQGDDIPLEARIVAVADIFDALTSHRPYKEAWSNQEAFAMLQKMAGSKLDKDCVDALLKRRDEVEKIQVEFQENRLGLS